MRGGAKTDQEKIDIIKKAIQGISYKVSADTEESETPKSTIPKTEIQESDLENTIRLFSFISKQSTYNCFNFACQGYESNEKLYKSIFPDSEKDFKTLKTFVNEHLLLFKQYLCGTYQMINKSLFDRNLIFPEINIDDLPVFDKSINDVDIVTYEIDNENLMNIENMNMESYGFISLFDDIIDTYTTVFTDSEVIESINNSDINTENVALAPIMSSFYYIFN